jgi:hypothetical protein
MDMVVVTRDNYFALMVIVMMMGRAGMNVVRRKVGAIAVRIALPGFQVVRPTIIVVVVMMMMVVMMITMTRCTDMIGTVICKFDSHFRTMKTSARHIILTPWLLVIRPRLAESGIWVKATILSK